MSSPVPTENSSAFVADVAAMYGRRLRRFLAMRLRNAADIADLAQEVYLRLLRVERHDQIRNPEAYLLTIAGHVLQQHALAGAASPETMEFTDAVFDARIADEVDPAASLHLEQRLAALDGALSRLSPKARAVFVLQRRDGCTIRSPEYATGIGERRTLTLADGTDVELDADSRIRVQFSAKERRVTLLEGQAFFRVAKNAARPFVVVSSETRIRDVGTQFDVNRTASHTIVTVVEGRVSVSSHDWSVAEPRSVPMAMRAIEIGAGEKIVVAAHLIPRPEPANLSAATAWTRNELIFDSTPLPQVALEFNRLNTRKMIIEGPRLQNFHVSGVFPALDPTSLPRFLTFLRSQPGVQVTQTGEQIIVTEK